MCDLGSPLRKARDKKYLRQLRIKVTGYPKIQNCQTWLNAPYRRFNVSFFIFTFSPGAKHRYLQMWKGWMKNTLVLFTMTPHSIIKLTVGNSKPHAFLWLSPGHWIRLSSKALLVCDIFGSTGHWHHSWVSALSAQARLNFDIYCRFFTIIRKIHDLASRPT